MDVWGWCSAIEFYHIIADCWLRDYARSSPYVALSVGPSGWLLESSRNRMLHPTNVTNEVFTIQCAILWSKSHSTQQFDFVSMDALLSIEHDSPPFSTLINDTWNYRGPKEGATRTSGKYKNWSWVLAGRVVLYWSAPSHLNILSILVFWDY